MKKYREFEIAYVGLKPGIHDYQFMITDDFFEKFEKPDFWNTQIDVKLSIDKKSLAMLLRFDINGTVDVLCDRCNENLRLTLWDEFELLVNMVDDDAVAKKSAIDAEVAYIGKSESILDVSEWVFEFIMLCMPLQRVHKENEQGESLCNPDVLKFLQQETEIPTNPLWNELKKNIKS